MVVNLITKYNVNPDKEKIAILSQYRAQINLICSLLPEYLRDVVNVITVIRSQGNFC